jgi:hypothetical protein
MQELCNSFKRSNLQIVDIKEGEEEQDKVTGNIINKIITENSSNLENKMPIQAKNPLGQ